MWVGFCLVCGRVAALRCGSYLFYSWYDKRQAMRQRGWKGKSLVGLVIVVVGGRRQYLYLVPI